MRRYIGATPRRRIGVRLFIWLTLVTVLIYALSTVFTIFRQREEIRETLIKEGASLADVCAGSLRTAVFAEDKKMIETIVQGIIMQEGVASVAVFNDTGSVLFSWCKGNASLGCSSMTPAFTVRMLETKSTFEFHRPVIIEVNIPDEEALFSESPHKLKKVVGSVCLSVDKVKLHSAMQRVIVLNTTILALFILAIALAIYFTVRRIAGPFEYRMAEMEKMEAIGTLARGIAHDFNNILGAVRGYLYVLKKRLESSSLIEYIVYTESALDRAKEMVESLLSFSNPDRSTFSTLDVNHVVLSLRQTIVPLVEGKYTYREALHEGSLIVAGNKLQLSQVVMNLVHNALDAMEGSGTLTIKTDAVDLSPAHAEKLGLQSGGQFARITVDDTGEGIDDSVQSKIFEPFFTTKEVGKGSGLGLSIVYGIVNEHGGFVHVDSVRSQSTSFIVYLPLYAMRNRRGGSTGYSERAEGAEGCNEQHSYR